MAYILSKNGLPGWRDENNVNNYKVLGKDHTTLRFQNMGGGNFLMKDANRVGYRTISASIPSGPVRIEGGTYHVRQYVYTKFIPSELIPYIEQRKSNPNIIFMTHDTINLYYYSTNNGMDVGEQTGIVFGSPYKSEQMSILVLDISNIKSKITWDGKLQLDNTSLKRLAVIKINIVVENPIRDEEIGSTYMSLQMYADRCNFDYNDGSNMSSTIYQDRLGIQLAGLYFEDQNTFGKNISTINDTLYTDEGLTQYRLIHQFFPKGTIIKIHCKYNAKAYEHIKKLDIKANHVNTSMQRYGAFQIFKTLDLSEAYHMRNYGIFGEFRKAIYPGDEFVYTLTMDAHKKVTFSSNGELKKYVMIDDIANDSFWPKPIFERLR